MQNAARRVQSAVQQVDVRDEQMRRSPRAQKHVHCPVMVKQRAMVFFVHLLSTVGGVLSTYRTEYLRSIYISIARYVAFESLVRKSTSSRLRVLLRPRSLR